MNNTTLSESTTHEELTFGAALEGPIVLVAFAPPGSRTVDRCLVGDTFVVGRQPECNLALNDNKVSKRHLRISRDGDSYAIEDLGSTNGTYLGGEKVVGQRDLPDGSVIRVGRAVLVFQEQGEALLAAAPVSRHGIEGRFHVAAMLEELAQAASSSRPVLLAGGTGSGKELAAQALAQLMGSKAAPLELVTHNAARFASAEEAATTLFGVSDKIFSGVSARPGLIEQAQGGALFLDEIQSLPQRVQRTLLRVLEDDQFARIGETRVRPASVRFIFASNTVDPTCGLPEDLFARLRMVRIPALSERRADIPTIFEALLRQKLSEHHVAHDVVMPLLSGDHFETLCLDGFAKHNVRGLIDLADRLATRIEHSEPPARALFKLFSDRFADSPVLGRNRGPAKTEQGGARSSHYFKHKDAIIAAYRECDGNLSATERLLRSRGIRSSRRWLGIFVERWGVDS